MNTCILIPSYEKYRALAGFTARQIDRHWRDHPPIFFCGFSVPVAQSDALLILHRSSDDWIGILMDAVREVRKKGFKMVYLILDDHPPLGPCEWDILNNVLPQIMLKREAENISLFGSGQGRNLEGRITLEAGVKVEQLPDSYLWRYSLHPGLWSLKALDDRLGKLDAKIPNNGGRTPWAFERLSGVRTSRGRKQEMTQCYRLVSSGWTASQRDQVLAFLYRACGVGARRMAGVLSGAASWDRMSHRFDFIHHYFGGPYPIIWQGLMAKGRLNPEFPKFCHYFLKRDLLRSATTLIADDVAGWSERV